MTIYETTSTKFHLDKEESYKFLKTISYCEEKITMRQFDSKKVSFSDFAEHLKNEDTVIKVTMFDNEKFNPDKSTPDKNIRIEFLARNGRFALVEGFFKDLDYEKLITAFDMAFRYIDYYAKELNMSYEDLCSKVLSISHENGNTVFHAFKDSDLLIEYTFTACTCFLKFDSRPLEEDEKKTLKATVTNE